MENKKSHNPPKANLALRIGVTGHRPEPADQPEETRKRPNPNISSIRATINEVLQVISVSFKGVADTNGELFELTQTGNSQHGGGTLRLVSALAAGSDQWVAEEAIKLGFELQSVLPFDRNEYLKDFSVQSDAQTYLNLLSKASAILELDGKVRTDDAGNRRPDNQSYEAVGRALLKQTDLLIAVWDGKDAQGRGGTGQVVREALQNGIPVVWIPWTSSEKWQLFSSYWHLLEEPADIHGYSDKLMEIIQKLLLPALESSPPELEYGKSLRNEYFKENQKKGNPQLGVWPLFRNIICGKIMQNGLKKTIKLFVVDDFEEQEIANSKNDWENKKSNKISMDYPFAENIRSWVDSRYLKHYAWANGLSMFYGNMHRSAFLINYLLSAIAVFLALVCIAHQITGKDQTGWIISELLVIIGILALTKRGQVRCWHQRWIDYRTLAERLRVARCMILLGGGGQQVSYEGHLTSYGNPSNTWMNWHYRAIERAAGVPPVSFTSEYLASCREFWKESLIEDQMNYHKGAFENFKKMDRRLHKICNYLFVATLIACAVHVAHIWLEGDPRFNWMHTNTGGWMTMLCAFLPALGAAFAAIRSHGEVQRLTQRSKAMEETLDQLQLDLASVPVTGNSLNSIDLRNKADRVSDLMTNEMLDWRVIFQDRPLGLPV